MINLIAGALPGLLKIGDKLIEDKDKRAEFAHKAMEIMLQTNTYKWVDALVKLSYASEQIVKGLFRPMLSASVWVAIFIWPDRVIEIIKQIHDIMGNMGDMGVLAGFSQFPAWMYSRHKEKAQKASKKPDPFEEDWGD